MSHEPNDKEDSERSQVVAIIGITPSVTDPDLVVHSTSRSRARRKRCLMDNHQAFTRYDLLQYVYTCLRYN